MKPNYAALILSALIAAYPAQAEDINIQEELSPKISNEQVEIRDYQHTDGSIITEHRLHGVVYMIKVQPAGNFPAYYLYDNEGNGNFQRRLAGNKQPVPPMWIIKKF